MTFFKKDLSISLSLILISSLVIYFINPSQPSNNQGVKKQSIPAGCSQDSKNGTTGLFKEIKKIELNNTVNIIPNIFADENQESVDIFADENQESVDIFANENQTSDEQNTEQQSLDNILTEVEKSLSGIKSEFEISNTCPTCGSDDKNNEWLEKELLATGYLTWEEYFSTPSYQIALEYFLENKDTLWDEEESSSLCSLMSSVGGGAGCSCEGAQGPCYTWVAYVQVWHCGGACCCACCSMCCK